MAQTKVPSNALAEGMDFAVSAYVYFVAFTLVVYMVATLAVGVSEIIINFLNFNSNAFQLVTATSRTALELQLLHTIAFTIVLVKAYKILISYAQTKHINIKYLVEIAIIAPTVELLFNAVSYPFLINVLFAVFAFANLIAYLHFYPTLKKVHTDYCKENGK